MSEDSDLKELERKHKVLDEKIAEVTNSPIYNDLQIKFMKKQKLKLKDEIERRRMAAA